MTEVESIFPYTIVEENGLYGITDNKGNLVVPCVMDEISNDKDEDSGMDTWNDFYCVIVRINDKYGFFTRNGKLIEPAYDEYAIDPCGDIYTKIDDSYGVINAPDYDTIKEISYSSSLLSEYGFVEDEDEDLDDEDFDDEDEDLEDDDEDFDDFDFPEDLDDEDELDDCDFEIEPLNWDAMEINPNDVSAIGDRLYALGYAFAEELWNEAYNQMGQDNIKEFVDETLHRLDDQALIEEKICDIKAQCEGDQLEFWDIVEGYDEYDKLILWCADMIRRGAVNFISLKSMAYANIPLLNRKIGELVKNDNNDGYYAIFRLIDKLLPCPEHRSFDIIPVKFPAGKRPSCRYSKYSWEILRDCEIGEIYLYEQSMHMYSVCVNIYDPEYPEDLIKKNHILDITNITLSELLIRLQETIDPAKENNELSAAIERALKIENGKSPLAQILTDCGIYALSLSNFGRSPRFYDGNIAEDVVYLCVQDDEVMLTLTSDSVKVNTVPLSERCGNYSWIVEDIKAAANIAYKMSKN
jgi:hypothetical protein